MGSVYLFNGTRYLLAAILVIPFVLRAHRAARATSGILHEQYRWMFVAGFVLFLGSAFLLSTGGRFEVQRSDTLELIGGMFWMLHVIVLGKYASRFEPMSFSLGQLVACGLFNLGLGLFVGPLVLFDAPVWVAIAYIAFFSIALCYTLQIWAQRHTPPADAALILSLESVFAVVSGWLLLHETLTPPQAAGCVLIFLAVLLSQFKEWNLRGTIDRDRLVEGR